ncbi:MAG: hypothetical protein SGPRY_006226 [Prymnesium sp.]
MQRTSQLGGEIARGTSATEVSSILATFQPLLWDPAVGKQLMCGTVFAYVAACSLIISLFGHGECHHLTSSEETACLVAAALHLAHVIVSRMPWRTNLHVSWARDCMHIVTLIACSANVSIMLGFSPTRFDPLTGRKHYMLRWVEWIVLAFTMTFMIESSAAAEYSKALATGLSQSLSTLCGFLFLFCTPAQWIFVALLSLTLHFHIYFRLAFLWREWKTVERSEPLGSMRLRAHKFSFIFLSACCFAWSGFVFIWLVDAVVYGLLGWPRGPVDYAFYWDIFMDVAAKLVCSSLIESSSPLLASQFTSDALEIAYELRLLIETASAPIVGVDRRCLVAEWNAKMAAITGVSREDALGFDLVECFVAPAQRSSVRHILVNALDGHDTFMFELHLLNSHGNQVEVLLNATARRNTENTIIGVLGIGQDVTAINNAEEKARKYAGEFSERLYRSYALSLDLVMHIDVTSKPQIYYASPSFQSVLGHPNSNLVDNFDQAMRLLSPKKDGQSFSAVVDRMRVEADGFTIEHPLRHIDGREVYFEHKASRHPDNLNCIIVISRDITDRRERHRLEVDNAKLERDVEAIHFLSHELKNRFVALHGLIETAHLTMAEYAPQLLSSPHNTQELAHGTYQPHASHVQILTALQIASARRADVTMDNDVPKLVILDQNLLLHILDNFVSNAIAYGPPNKRAAMRAIRLSNRLRCEVINLPGPKHNQARALYGEKDAAAIIIRHGEGLQRSASSTGNGLRIARKCAHLLGGEMNLCFHPHCVTASVTVPLSSDEDNTVPPLPPDVVVASLDDDDMIRTLDEMFFDKYSIKAFVRGATPSEIWNFPDFVASLDPQPDIVLVDQNLNNPVTCDYFCLGTDLIPQLRSKGYTGKIIIKSANQSSADRAFYLANGADDSMDKILKDDAFACKLATVLHEKKTVMRKPIDLDILHDVDSKTKGYTQLFMERAPALAENARTLYAEGLQVRAWNSVHKLKALARMVGAWPLSEACEILRQAQLVEEWTQGLEHVVGETSKVMAALKELDG